MIRFRAAPPMRLHSQPHIAPTPVTLARAIYASDHSCQPSSANAAQACNARARLQLRALAAATLSARAAPTCAMAGRGVPAVVNFARVCHAVSCMRNSMTYPIAA